MSYVYIELKILPQGMILMKDDNGFYYYPFPDNKQVRMYVKEEKNTIYFRLWNSEDEKLWKDHGWVPYEAIQQASDIYSGNSFNPGEAYDISIARALLKESG